MRSIADELRVRDRDAVTLICTALGARHATR